MIDRIHNTYIAECENCGASISENSWDDLMCEMKAEGWQFQKVGDEWLHYCPVCKEKLRPTAANDFAGIGGTQ